MEINQCIADKREAAYEISGEGGSCYMFDWTLLALWIPL
jgi:hypothetical protein